MQSGGSQSRKFLILADEDPGSLAGLWELHLLLVEFSTMQGSPSKKKSSARVSRARLAASHKLWQGRRCRIFTALQ
jgi:hypothetical protein